MSPARPGRSARTFLAATLLVASTIGVSLAAGTVTGPFTAGQASKGEVVFNDYCAECHRPDLTGALGPSLVNDAFKQTWGAKPVADLRDWIYANMPPNAPGTLPDDQLDPIVAWIVSKNGVRPGDKPLSAKTANAPFLK